MGDDILTYSKIQLLLYNVLDSSGKYICTVNLEQSQVHPLQQLLIDKGLYLTPVWLYSRDEVVSALCDVDSLNEK